MKINIDSGAIVQITDKPIYTNIGDIVQQKVIQVREEIKKEDEIKHFPLNNTIDEGIRLFRALTEEMFLQGALDSWLYLLGFTDQKPLHLKIIKWIGTKQELREMLRILFEGLIKAGSLTMAEIERITPNCFIDKNNKPLELAKAKEELSHKMDKLKEIFRPSSQNI